MEKESNCKLASQRFPRKERYEARDSVLPKEFLFTNEESNSTDLLEQPTVKWSESRIPVLGEWKGDENKGR